MTLNVALGGAGEPIIFLHGFPESHRTWRHQLANLGRDHFVVAPDQRGFAASDKPAAVEEYRTDKIVADLIALADALRWRSDNSLWSATTGAARLPGLPR